MWKSVNDEKTKTGFDSWGLFSEKGYRFRLVFQPEINL